MHFKKLLGFHTIPQMSISVSFPSCNPIRSCPYLILLLESHPLSLHKYAICFPFLGLLERYHLIKIQCHLHIPDNSDKINCVISFIKPDSKHANHHQFFQ